MRSGGLTGGLEETGLGLEKKARDGGSYCCCPVTEYISSPCDRAGPGSAAARRRGEVEERPGRGEDALCWWAPATCPLDADHRATELRLPTWNRVTVHTMM